MNTYHFTFSPNYTSTDTTTPVSGPCSLELVFEAASCDDAKTALAAAFSTASAVNLTNIIVIPA